MNGATCLARGRGSTCRLVPLVFDTQTGNCTNLSKVLDRRVKRVTESTG